MPNKVATECIFDLSSLFLPDPHSSYCQVQKSENGEANEEVNGVAEKEEEKVNGVADKEDEEVEEEDDDEEDESSDPDIEDEIQASTQQDGPGQSGDIRSNVNSFFVFSQCQLDISKTYLVYSKTVLGY